MYATHGFCHSVWMTGIRVEWTSVPDSYPHRVTDTKCRIDTVISPDDGRIVTRNM